MLALSLKQHQVAGGDAGVELDIGDLWVDPGADLPLKHPLPPEKAPADDEDPAIGHDHGLCLDIGFCEPKDFLVR